MLRERLSPMQYKVTQKNGTEPPFQNEYWDNKRGGLYVDVVSGEPLFSTLDKFDSGTGWPSFTKPLEPENIMNKEDRSFFTVRTEVRSRYGRFTSRSSFFRRSPSYGDEILHKFCISQVYSQRRSGKGRIGGVPQVVQVRGLLHQRKKARPWGPCFFLRNNWALSYHMRMDYRVGLIVKQYNMSDSSWS